LSKGQKCSRAEIKDKGRQACSCSIKTDTKSIRKGTWSENKVDTHL
jgi:hypothetical protein